MSRLKACPFCGGKAEICFSGTPERGGYIVARCRTCRASAGAAFYRGPAIDIPLEETVGGEMAEDAWNRRMNDED